MFPRPRHHNPGWWSRDERPGVHAVARALTRLIEAESRHEEWSETGWQRRQPRSPSWGHEPRRFNGPPTRSPPWRMPAPGPWLPGRRGNARPRENWQQPPRQSPWFWRASMWPRRGPPVAAVRAPRWDKAEWEKRRSRGFEPRGPLRGGPERPVDDPQRKPRGGLCGGPARSANDPQTPPRSSPAKVHGE